MLKWCENGKLLSQENKNLLQWIIGLLAEERSTTIKLKNI